ncbi:DUF2637 domain-containing protein [Nocardia vinacea]|uniref:DUF2637 domain-containing protein n=1 Tax=Nocardia vinacea TaxID=96468 RepID=A0ABZ1YNZ1_9NOCA|nr:DUF2637 domain-containing protein [Nocardia vinacea]
MPEESIDSPHGGVHTAWPAPTARKPRAHAFFWTVLTAAAIVSITGNATQALLHDTALPAVAAAVAVIPPLALLAAVHGVSVLLRAHAGARGTHVVATAMTAFIAIGAFWLSFTALRSLAITAGVPHGEAWLWPLIIEGSMAQATVALLTLAHSTPHSDSGSATADPCEPQNTCTPMATPAATQPEVMIDSDRVRTPPPLADRTHAEFREAAVLLCARDPGRRRDPDMVARALTHHHLDGWTPTRIARELNKSRSTISRILSDAATIETIAPEILAAPRNARAGQADTDDVPAEPPRRIDC